MNRKADGAKIRGQTSETRSKEGPATHKVPSTHSSTKKSESAEIDRIAKHIGRNLIRNRKFD